jgi:hypothetical protein
MNILKLKLENRNRSRQDEVEPSRPFKIVRVRTKIKIHLAHTTKDGETTMALSDVVDELLNRHSLSDADTTKEAKFSTTSVGSEQVDNLDTGLEDLSGG